MKIIFRTLIILVAAAIIAGIGFAIVQFSGVNQANAAGFPANGEGGRHREGNVETFSGERPDFAGGRGEQREFEGDGSGMMGLNLAGLGKNLGMIAGIVVIYWLMSKFVEWMRAKKTPVSQV